MANTDTTTEDVKKWYLSNFDVLDEKLNGTRNGVFHQLRKAAISRFSKLGFPTPRNEDWKYTNVAPILQHKFKFPQGSPAANYDLKPLLFQGLQETVIVLVNGKFSSTLSNIGHDDSPVVVSVLSDAMSEHREIMEAHLGQYARFDDEAFTALNTAFAVDGTLLYVPDNTIVEAPIHLIYISDSSQDSYMAYPRNLFVVGKNSQASIVETYYGKSDGHYFNNVVGEVLVSENARLDHLKVQEEARSAFHISNLAIRQERDSYFNTISVDLGGSLVRNNISLLLNDENCESHLFGFYMGSGSQHIDNHTFIDHAKPNCFSNELYKGVLDDKARGVFNGRILVRQDAQKTNALQSNKTLLLTDDASINAKPQLEIFADDVKCTHGATIGQLDDEALFYLRARGISEEMAGAMLRHAFVGDVLAAIKYDPIREYLDKKIIERFTE